MKIATLLFARPDTKRAYTDALRQRMYAAGYEPHQVTEIFRGWFSKAPIAVISGTDEAERACDVAREIRGVMCKMKEG